MLCSNAALTTNSIPTPNLQLSFSSRHPDFSFADGNIALLANNVHFIVHQGFLSRHARSFATAIRDLGGCSGPFIEGHPVLELDDAPSDLYQFLLALYDGVYVSHGSWLT